jgi:hypothetical protein
MTDSRHFVYGDIMKEIPLTQGKAALVDDADYEFLNQWKWCTHQFGKKWYAVRGQGTRKTQKILLMHRVITNAPDGMEVDHWDHDGLNNQRYNLRVCTSSQNKANKPKRIDNTSGYKGVTWDRFRGKYVAQIHVNGKHIFLGRFSDVEEAARAYDKAAIKIFGEFAYLNFPK